MQIFLLRHATRNFTMGDVSLNEEGLAQAQTLALNPTMKQLSTILSSPKKRALMTVEPLSKSQKLKVEINDSLDQLRHGESEDDFSTRVQSFINKVEAEQWQSPLVICTHSDWLATAAQLIASDESDLKYHMFQCAEFLTFEIKDGLWFQK